ncbi:MAG: antiterminator LoaP [Lachnospiraceae bacterium]|nr:antiterminator LoaP [Lachnospiraceae bacterium]
MWYVIQTLKGRERKVAEAVRRDVACEGEKVFIIENEMQYKVKGEWIKDRKPLFAGYVFVELEFERAEEFNNRLRTKLHTFRLLDIDGVITPIRPEEEEYLLRLGGEEHIIHHSAGFRVDDIVEITSGSFQGFRGKINKLDRHNRRAKICLPLLGKNIEVEIGLEIVKNTTSGR